MVAFLSSGSARAHAQITEADIVRPAPPKLDQFETDENGDGVPDGWYNLRDGKVVNKGGVSGPKFVRFECEKPGRPARLSRAFGVDGKKYEAIILGMWVKADRIQYGEREGDEPGLRIDFLGPKLRQTSRGQLWPWNARTFALYGDWTLVRKRIPVPPDTLDAIMSVGLLGATGVLDIDGFSAELVPRGGVPTTNLVPNPGLELGDPAASGWTFVGGARRTFPGHRSSSALELTRNQSLGRVPLALPVEPFPSLEVTVFASAKNLRGAGGAEGGLFFLNDEGNVLAAPDGNAPPPIFTWDGSFEWQESRQVVNVPRGAVRAVIQFKKTDANGLLKIDDVSVTVAPNDAAGTWTPYHVPIDDDQERWLPIKPSTEIKAGSALDVSFLLDGPAGKKGAVGVKDGRLTFANGSRARFFGVQFLPPLAFLEQSRVEKLADRLARSGINLVRLGDLDTPLGPDLSLIDDSLDDTKELDANALARLDHVIATLKSRGIYVAVELQGARRFRSDDGVAMAGALPPGGGPASVIDPTMTKLVTGTARSLLAHVNPETKLPLNHDPALAWVTLAGEVSLFDLTENPNALPGDYAKAYRTLAASTTGDRKRFWQHQDATQRRTEAEVLRKAGLKAPVASVSHWRREKEFSEAVGEDGFDLVDDRIYWFAPQFLNPNYRSTLWDRDGGLLNEANGKRRADKPYVVGQWCDFTQGVWASPYEAAEQLLAARTAASHDWDAIVRRGLFIHPDQWGSAAPGTGGGEDIFQIPEVANSAPHVFALWPHAASILLRGHERDAKAETAHTKAGARGHRIGVPGWEPSRGRLVIETPYTEGLAGWPGGDPVALGSLNIELENAYGVVVASSVGPEPLAKSKRLLVTAIARVAPTGFAYTDPWKRETADPGQPPLLQEPVIAKLTWKHAGPVKAFALDNNGERAGEAKLVKAESGWQLVIDGTVPALHWELVAE